MFSDENKVKISAIAAITKFLNDILLYSLTQVGQCCVRVHVCMCHMGVSDYWPFPEDCDKLSLINDTESNATVLYYSSPTSTVISLGDWCCRLTSSIQCATCGTVVSDVLYSKVAKSLGNHLTF